MLPVGGTVIIVDDPGEYATGTILPPISTVWCPMTLALSTEELISLRGINPYRFRPLCRVYGGDNPPQTVPREAGASIHRARGITVTTLTMPLATLVEADAAAIRQCEWKDRGIDQRTEKLLSGPS